MVEAARAASPRAGEDRLDPRRHDLADIEPGILTVLDRRAARKAASGPYRACSTNEIEDRLRAFLAREAPGATLGGIARLGGGASKEQFLFTLGGSDEWAGRYVLRREPIQSISESDRGREVDLLNVARARVPAPEPIWLDAEGAAFGQPSAIMRFVDGVTKPRLNALTVSGLGTWFEPDLRRRLAPQFIEHLAAIHAIDTADPGLSRFQRPDADHFQAARWQVNWWARVQREDLVQPIPVMTLAEQWMRANLPAAHELVLVHGDYRTGNYLFDEDAGAITAILDWELAHIGDFHEDLAWILQRAFGFVEDGEHLASGLFRRHDLIERYETATGRRVDPATLRFYEILAAYKCVVITLATGMKAARDQHNHQDVLLTWLAAAGHIFLAEIARLLGEATAR